MAIKFNCAEDCANMNVCRFLDSMNTLDRELKHIKVENPFVDIQVTCKEYRSKSSAVYRDV